MACLLAKSLAFNPLTRPDVLFRPGVASSSRFFSSLFRLDDSNEFNCKLKPPTNCRSNGALHAVYHAFCPRISATRNMARILNLMDDSVGVIAADSGCPRWDVMQDVKALYLVRDMSGLPRKDEIFREERITEHRVVFGCVRVLHFGCTLTLLIGTEGPDPGAAYQGYRVRMWLPAPYSSVWDIKMGVKNEVLTIIVPKERKGKWIHRFTMLPDFYSP